MHAFVKFAAAASLAVFALSACEKKADTAAPVAAAPVDLKAPTTNDTAAWKVYFEGLMTQVTDQKFRRPYVYFVPMGDDEESKRQYTAQLENAQNAIGRGVLAGSMLAFGGPDATHTADLMIESFKYAGPKSLKGVRVVYVGDSANSERVKTVAAPSEAEYVYIEMKH